MHSHDWDGQTEPTYGSTAAYSGPDPDTGATYIYAVGAGNNTYNYLWLTRVAQANAFNISAYEYWNGTGWQSQRLINPTAQQAIKEVAANGTTSVMTDYSQGSINWSPYYKAWIFFDVRSHDFAISDLRVRTSTRPEGPWGPLTLVTQTGQQIPSTASDQNGNLTIANLVYAFSQQPWYDNSGKSTLATFTYGTSVQRLLNIVRPCETSVWLSLIMFCCRLLPRPQATRSEHSRTGRSEELGVRHVLASPRAQDVWAQRKVRRSRPE